MSTLRSQLWNSNRAKGYFALTVLLIILLEWLYCPAPAAEGETLPSIRAKQQGPWGDLQISYIQIGPPIDFVPELRTVNRPRTWQFPDWEADQLRDFLETAPLPPSLREKFIGKIKNDPRSGGVCILPDNEDILSLSPKARAWIYNQLAGYKVNRAHDMANRYASPSLKEWMRGVNLSATTWDVMNQLVYRNGNMLFFADTSVLMEHIPTAAERQEVFRALSREKTMLVKICLHDDSDTYALAKYWGRGNRAKDVFPLLDSLKRSSGDHCIDIVHLLPPFVRSRIYTYPDINSLAPETRQLYDCHWTSFNFFNAVPDNSYNTSGKIKRHLETNFYSVKRDELQLGDVLLYLNNGRLLHSAVYIAADILFTKNGTNLSSPWMFMHLDDMENYYACNQPLQILYLRSRGNI